MIQTVEKIDIESFLQGDYKSFEIVVNLFKDRVVNICYSYTNNYHDAEDVAQEVFVELYRSLHKFKNQSTLSIWIYRIASNKAIDFIRSKKRQKRGSGQIGYLEDQKYYDWIVGDNKSADDELIQQQRKSLLYDALNKLPSRQKEAYVLTQIEGFDQSTVAEIMETSVKSVESLVVRSKKKLKQILEKRIKEYL